MAFLRIIFIFALLYFAARFLGRLIFPPRSNYYNDPGSRDSRSNRKEGDITVENKASRTKRINKDEGDYVDYEDLN